jgi:hypothetical protein
MDGQMDGPRDGPMDGRRVGEMDGQMDGQIDPRDRLLERSERLEPLEGWRAWRLVRRPDGRLGLGSLFSPKERWAERRAARAVCAVEASFHAAPAVDCRCGYYAYADPARLAGASRRSAVIGSVAMWGSVVGHDFGYRAEYAYPQRLRLVCGRCLRIGRDRAPAWLVERYDELTAVCARHAPRVRRSGRLPAAAAESELLGAYAVDLLPATGLRPPPPVRRLVRALPGLLGASTSIGWLLVAVLVASLAFWSASRTSGEAPAPASGPSASVAAAAAPGDTGVGQPFVRPSAGVVLKRTCGVGKASNIRIVPCSQDHAWISNVIFRPGVLPRCFGAVVEARPGGRRICWVPATA